MLDLELMTAIASLAQVAIAAVGIVTIVVTLGGLRKQLWTQTFCEFTRRYSELVRHLPVGAMSGHLKSLSEFEDQAHILSNLTQYFNLCAEEHYLHSRGTIDHALWGIWCSGMKDAMRFPLFRDCWRELRQEYAYHPPFQSFMDDLAKHGHLAHEALGRDR
jgi:hypothetical protein